MITEQDLDRISAKWIGWPMASTAEEWHALNDKKAPYPRLWVADLAVWIYTDHKTLSGIWRPTICHAHAHLLACAFRDCINGGRDDGEPVYWRYTDATVTGTPGWVAQLWWSRRDGERRFGDGGKAETLPLAIVHACYGLFETGYNPARPLPGGE